MEQEKKDNFSDLGLSEDTVTALKQKGFEEPTDIQKKCIPVLLKNEKDVVAQAQTGTGKTAAFSLPLIDLLEENARRIQVLVLSPTRELAIQVAEEMNSLIGKKRLHVVPIYGGQSISQQMRKIEKGADVIVGTPGRVLDYIKRGTLVLDDLSFIVLDEADEMLNMGFLEDVEIILKRSNPDKRTLLFSATMPDKIFSLSKKYMKEFEVIKVKKVELTTNLTDQIYFEVSSSDKFEALCRIIDIEDDFYGFIFCRTKKDVDFLNSKLHDRGYDVDALHGDISQSQREKTLDRFRKRKIDILVATDVAARGIDIQDLTHVINYALPQDPESYVHRIGRTGRAGKEGTAITFITPDEYRRLMFIQKLTNTDIRNEKLPDAGEIVNVKKSRLITRIDELIDNDQHHDYLEFAQAMLEKQSPENIISALIKHAFRDEFDERSYNEIRTVNVDQKGKTRLFVALGRKDNMNARSLVTLIKNKAKVRDQDIQDVRVFDNYSFVSAPFREAEMILQAFYKDKSGRSIVQRAKKKNEKDKIRN